MTEEQEELFQNVLRITSVAFPVLLCVLMLFLIGKLDTIADEVKAAPARMTPMAMPAGVYICDGDKCVIANSKNIEGVGKSR